MKLRQNGQIWAFLNIHFLRINQLELQLSLQKVYTWLVQNHARVTIEKAQSFDWALSVSRGGF